MFFKRKDNQLSPRPITHTVKKSKSAKDLFHKLTNNHNHKRNLNSISSVSSPIITHNVPFKTPEQHHQLPQDDDQDIDYRVIKPIPQINSLEDKPHEYKYPHQLYHDERSKPPSIPPPFFPSANFTTPISPMSDFENYDDDLMNDPHSPKKNIRSHLIKSGDVDFGNDTESFMNGILSTSTSRQESARESSVSLTEAQIQVFHKYNKNIRLVENIISDYENAHEEDNSKTDFIEHQRPQEDLDLQKLELMLLNEKNQYLLKKQKREITHLNKLLTYQQSIITKLSKEEQAKSQKLLPPFKLEKLAKTELDSIVSSDESSIMSTPGQSRKISSSSSSSVHRNNLK